METLTFGTTNEAKIKQIGGVLLPVGIKVEGLPDKNIIPEVVEDGKTAVDNARKKALAYSKALGKSVFSMTFHGLRYTSPVVSSPSTISDRPVSCFS